MSYNQDQLDTLNTQLEALQAELKSKQSELDNFVYEATEAEYDDYLNDLYGSIEICGLSFTPSDIVKKCDPVAYRCGKSDYEAGYDLDNCEEYAELKEEVEELDYQVEDLETEINDIESE